VPQKPTRPANPAKNVQGDFGKNFYAATRCSSAL